MCVCVYRLYLSIKIYATIKYICVYVHPNYVYISANLITT